MSNEAQHKSKKLSLRAPHRKTDSERVYDLYNRRWGLLKAWIGATISEKRLLAGLATTSQLLEELEGTKPTKTDGVPFGAVSDQKKSLSDQRGLLVIAEDLVATARGEIESVVADTVRSERKSAIYVAWVLAKCEVRDDQPCQLRIANALGRLILGRE